MEIRKRTKETKGANRIFVVVGNELGEEYKGDEVDEKKKENEDKVHKYGKMKEE